MTIQEFQGLSLATLAELTQKPLSSWSRWVTGRKMNIETLKSCSAKLCMSSDDFLAALEMRKTNKLITTKTYVS
jgi:hypothetical protein